MKNNTIRKIAFGLAATSIISMTTGCSKKEKSDIPTTAITTNEDTSNVYIDQPSVHVGDTIEFKGNTYVIAHSPESEYIENIYNKVSYDNGIDTKCLFFVRVDGRIYLATKVVDKNENNVISKYYAIDTGEFLGQTLDVNWYARATKKIEDIIPGVTKSREYSVSVNGALLDQNYFDGEYGLGKNLFSGAVINASSIFSDERLSKEQIELLLSDPLLVASYVEKFQYSNMLEFSKEEYTFIPLAAVQDFVGFFVSGYYVGFRGETSNYYNEMQIFSIEDGEDKKDIVGYRASTVSTDRGYNYVYDISSSSFVDLSQCKILDIKYEYANRTVGNIRKQYDNPFITFYSIEDLKVFSTLNLEGDDVFEKYYIAMCDEHFMGSTYRYSVLGENEFVALSGNYDGSRLCIAKNEFIKTTPLGAFDGMMISLEECLTENGLGNFIKETYTEEELMLLLTKLRSKDLNFGEISNYVSSAYEKINSRDIIVVDTTKESGNEVLVNGDKKYYVLIPYEVSDNIKAQNQDIRYYETCDHNALVAISLEQGYVRIDNVGKTFYWVYKTDGELSCVSALESILREIEMDDFVRDEYSLIDLQLLADRMNEKEKTFGSR